MGPLLGAAAAVVVLPLLAGVGGGAPAALDGREWALYLGRFVAEDGRVVDTGNGGISHSEGQGYAMLLAVAFGDPVTFERLWRWTRSRLQVRDDQLFAWRWDPAAGRVTDRNSASDGDLLIAWALTRAGEAWGVPRYLDEARGIARDLRARLVRRHDGLTILLPGPEGFVHDGVPTVNPSYWVFPAFAALDRIDPAPVWSALDESGRRLLATARFSRHDLPPDWLRLTKPPVPAPGRPARFGYDAVRVPLYLIWGGVDDWFLLAPFDRFWHGRGGRPPPPDLDLVSGTVADYPAPPGVVAIATLTRWALRHGEAEGGGRRAGGRHGGDGRGPPAFPALDRTTDYFASSLLLLAKVAYSERFES